MPRSSTVDSYNPPRNSYFLVDVAARQREYPDTFWIPSRIDRENVPIGKLVKLIFSDKERMWVEVKDVSRTHHQAPPPYYDLIEVAYTGLLSNMPADHPGLLIDAEIKFGPEHIMEIEQ